jgi:hypothetical protein
MKSLKGKFFKVRDLRLSKYIADHPGEMVTADEIFQELEREYPEKSGFKSARAIAQVLRKFDVEIVPKGYKKKTNLYKL